MMRTASLLLVLASIVSARDRTAAIAPDYAALRAGLRASAVPVLLPQPWPTRFGPVRSIALISVGRSGYYVGFSTLEHCSGALSCASFHVAGFPGARAVPPTPGGRPVRLPDGTRAVFRPTDCSGAGCTEATLTFARGGAVYELDAKVVGDARITLEGVYRSLRVMR